METRNNSREAFVYVVSMNNINNFLIESDKTSRRDNKFKIKKINIKKKKRKIIETER
jgi:hypothetical protein